MDFLTGRDVFQVNAPGFQLFRYGCCPALWERVEVLTDSVESLRHAIDPMFEQCEFLQFHGLIVGLFLFGCDRSRNRFIRQSEPPHVSESESSSSSPSVSHTPAGSAHIPRRCISGAVSRASSCFGSETGRTCSVSSRHGMPPYRFIIIGWCYDQ